MDPEEMRVLGHRVVDLLVELVTRGPASPPIRTATREEMERRLVEPPPPTIRAMSTSCSSG